MSSYLSGRTRYEELLARGANKHYYRDTGLYIYSSTDGQLDVIADTTFKATAPTCELEATTVTLDGNTSVDGAHTFTTGTGTVTVNGATTLAAATTVNANMTFNSGDLIRRSAKYISGGVGRPTGYTRASGALSASTRIALDVYCCYQLVRGKRSRY